MGWFAPMQRLAAALDEVAGTRSRKAKSAALARLWRALPGEALAFAARLVLGEPLPPGLTLGVGWAMAAQAAAQAGGVDATALALRSRELGDFGDAVAALFPARPPALTLEEVARALEAIAGTTERAEKLARLQALLARATPGEARYLARALLGEVRVGVQRGVLEESLAEAFERPLPALRRAAALTPDVGELARLAQDGRLEEAALHPGRPVGFMLASPVQEVRQPVDPALTVVEDKLDGVRVQAHVVEGRATLFARGQGDVTRSFPEVAAALAGLGREVVLDGELIAVDAEGRPRPFQALQARLGRREPERDGAAGVAVAYVAFDCLHDGAPLLEAPWRERRARLEALGVTVNPARPLDPARPLEPQLDAEFDAARARGHEGLVLKRVDAAYEAGQRGSAWRKVKRAYATLDVVVTRAERGHGKRAGVLSDYTFAVWKGERLVEIGKAYTGLTDAEIAALTARLEGLAVERRGPYLLVRPEVVLEVAFDGLQRSGRHDSGFALRFPRIARVREDKKAEEADRLESVTALWEALVKSRHREETKQGELF